MGKWHTDNTEHSDPAQIHRDIRSQRETEVLHGHRPFEPPLHAAQVGRFDQVGYPVTAAAHQFDPVIVIPGMLYWTPNHLRNSIDRRFADESVVYKYQW
jgi:hypothetical protein